MRRIVTQPCIVLGSADRAGFISDDLRRRGVQFVSTARSIGQLRRHLVLGEDAALTLCVLLSVDDLSPADRAHLAQMLADRGGFATRVFCLGIIGAAEEFQRWATLGCDAYVNDSRAAVEVIRAATHSTIVTNITAQQLLRCTAGNELMDSAVCDAATARTLRPASKRKVRSNRARSAITVASARRGKLPPT